MYRFGLLIGLLAILLQNLVFWQSLLPSEMHQQMVCEQISEMMNHSSMQSEPHLSHHIKNDSHKKLLNKNVQQTQA